MLHDQYSDKSFRVLYNKLHDFPNEVKDLIKTAEINYNDAETLPSTSFAWPERRKYAMHTKEHAVLSKIYSSGEEVPSYVKDNIDRALSLYGVEKVSAVEKTAEEIPAKLDEYLVPHMRLGKLEDAESVKEASRFFVNNTKKMDMETRVNAAVSLVKKAKELNVNIPSRIYKHAGLTQSNRKILTEWLEARKEASQSDEPVKLAFDKLASYVSDTKNKLANRGDLLKLADAIYTLDKKANLMKYYDRTLPDPVLTVFNTTKLAEETVTLAGKDIPASVLLSIPKESYGDIMGADIVPEITDEAGNLSKEDLLSILKTLPADMQIVLVKQLGF